MNTNELLAEREKTHGQFWLQAAITQRLNDDFIGPYLSHDRENTVWPMERPGVYFTAVQRVCLHMIALKIGRILAGDPNCVDHWRDLCGYSQLVVNELEDRNV